MKNIGNKVDRRPSPTKKKIDRSTTEALLRASLSSKFSDMLDVAKFNKTTRATEPIRKVSVLATG